MMKSPRNQAILLAVLLVVLGVWLYRDFRPATPVAALSVNDQPFQPLPVENPSLRLDLLDQLKRLEYQGTHRNIFSMTPPPPPPARPPEAVVAKPAVPAAPPPPPPLVVPATFFGYVTDARSGTRRAFFSEGDDVYVVGIGEVLLGRFRLVQIGNSTAELEEVPSGRRATLTLQEQPTS